MKSNKYFVKVSIVLYLFSIIPILFIWIFINNTYENKSIDIIVKEQLNTNAIYNSKFTALNNFSYKLALVKYVKPKILALGSSRVMQFRKEFFTTSFINAGGSMNHLNEGMMFLNEMIKKHKPEYIILGLDFWWFNSTFPQPIKFPRHDLSGLNDKNKQIITIFSSLKNGQLDLNTFISGILSLKNDTTNYINIGINSIDNSNGFRSDGSRLYTNFIFGSKKNNDEYFKNTLSRIKKGNSRFQYASFMSKDRIKEFKKILKFCKINKIHLIIFIPPVSSIVYNEMILYKQKYNFINELELLLSNLEEEHYIYHDVSILNSSDCEFVDGFHGGDVVYQRILQNMYNNKSSLSKYINIKIISESIKNNEGKVLTIFDKSNYKRTSEVDFLKIGCKK